MKNISDAKDIKDVKEPSIDLASEPKPPSPAAPSHIETVEPEIELKKEIRKTLWVKIKERVKKIVEDEMKSRFSDESPITSFSKDFMKQVNQWGRASLRIIEFI